MSRNGGGSKEERSNISNIMDKRPVTRSVVVEVGRGERRPTVREYVEWVSRSAVDVVISRDGWAWR